MKRSCLLAAALLAACSPIAEGEQAVALSEERHGEGEPTPLERALDTARDDCLLLVWGEQEKRDVAFDRANDLAEGGAISCATGTTASQFRAAITAIREAAQSGNKARMLEEIGIPMLYIDAEGNRRPLEDREAIEALFDKVFDPRMLEVLQRIELDEMTVVQDQGAFFELGTLWLVVDEAGGRPRIVTVNRQALDDAAEAAKEKAVRDQGEAVPLAHARS